MIIDPTAEACDLARLPFCEAAKGRISVNQAKFTDLENVEVIVDAMPFLLSRLTAAETIQRLAARKDEPHLSDVLLPMNSAIGVAPRDNLTSARHLSEVNQHLLLLGSWIGESVDATAAAWLPARTILPFAEFDQLARHYLENGLFPTSFQTSFSKTGDGCFATLGLDYFAGQEIRMTAPPDYSPSDLRQCLAPIIDTIATRGKINRPARSTGLNEGETLICTPNDDLQFVDIIIQRGALDSIPPNR
ncbi:hypothetical protein [Parasphingorhabdus sp.]|uniref:hypothetical protein n=1 Tax=Parasphingorhabdus sp. TaxID=2709688 RepID=UPI0035944137